MGSHDDAYHARLKAYREYEYCYTIVKYGLNTQWHSIQVPWYTVCLYTSGYRVDRPYAMEDVRDVTDRPM